MNINLLPLEFIRRRIIRSALRFWSVIGVVILLGTTIVLIPEYNELQALHGDFEKMQKNNLSIHTILEKKTEMENQIVQLEREKTTLEKVLPDGRVMSILAILSRCVRQAEGKLQIQKFGFATNYVDITVPVTPPTGVNGAKVAPSKPAANGANEAAPLAPLTTMVLNGVAKDDKTVGNFIQFIKETSIFSHIDLKSCSESPLQGNNSGWAFQLECRL